MYNDFYNRENDGLRDVPSYMNGNTYQAGPSNPYPAPQPAGGDMGGQPDGGKRKKPKKQKAPFLTKKAAAVVLALCIGAAGVTGFGAGMMTGSGNAATAGASASDSVVPVSSDLASGSDLSVSQIVDKAADAIVDIRTEVTATNQFMQQVSGESAGSGVIVSDDGYVITNNHVIENATSINVTLKNGESYEAKLLGTDPELDVAVLKIEAEGLTAVTFGDSDALAVGDTTVVIGNPLGKLGGTVTNGIVSALNRQINLGEGTMNLIQTNAAINAGNSGGGMFNGKGELIGVIVAKSGGTNVEGLGYAIPINDVKAILSDLVTNGYVTGRIDSGMEFIDISSAQEAMMYGLENTGVYVLDVKDGSQAAQKGIKSGDRIVSIDGQEVSTASEIKDILSKHAIGDTIEVTVERSGKTGSTQITLAEEVPDNALQLVNS